MFHTPFCANPLPPTVCTSPMSMEVAEQITAPCTIAFAQTGSLKPTIIPATMAVRAGRCSGVSMDEIDSSLTIIQVVARSICLGQEYASTLMAYSNLSRCSCCATGGRPAISAASVETRSEHPDLPSQQPSKVIVSTARIHLMNRSGKVRRDQAGW